MKRYGRQYGRVAQGDFGDGEVVGSQGHRVGVPRRPAGGAGSAGEPLGWL